jgi:exopolysaccharide biosynthesis WecB/TagA/CpsF family protein
MSEINVPEKVTVGGFPIVRLSRKKFAELMVSDWKKQLDGRRSLLPKISYSANGQIIAEVNGNSEMHSLYKRADYIDADGMWIVFASKILGQRKLTERVSTTDFFHDAARAAELNGLSFFILGSTPENNDAACKKIKYMYPGLKIAGSHHGYFGEQDEHSVIEKISASKADILWVAMGYPRQELFVDRNAPKLRGIAWVKTCGGLLEHILELHPRAPLWVQKIGFEWLHRLLQEPRRLGVRYLRTNPLAMWYLLTKTERGN